MGSEINKISPQKAVKILNNNGLKIEESEAKKVLEIMYFLAKLIVMPYLRSEIVRKFFKRKK